jgi:predicted GNAT family N-acyltransferase
MADNHFLRSGKGNVLIIWRVAKPVADPADYGIGIVVVAPAVLTRNVGTKLLISMVHLIEN